MAITFHSGVTNRYPNEIMCNFGRLSRHNRQVCDYFKCPDGEKARCFSAVRSDANGPSRQILCLWLGLVAR